jgi:multidrug resistance protein
MDPNAIELQRTKTRATIITALSERIQREQDDLEKNVEPSYPYQPENEEALPTKDDGVEFQDIDPELVTWDGPDDPQNPRNWSTMRKWRSCGVAAMYTLLGPFASTMLSPAVSDISKEFGNTNTVISSLMVSIFVLAWALFSPLIAPLSEMYGRRPVMNISIWFLFFFNIGCALAQNTAQMCVFRLLSGIGACAPISIGAGVIGDLFDNKQRGKAMSIYSLGPTMGPCISSLISGFIVQGTDWRWCFWVLVIFNAVVGIQGTLCLEETYAPELLKRKAQKLRKLTGNEHLHSLYEIATGETVFDKFYVNLTRPLVMLCTHPMVFGLGLFMAIAYGCLYIMIVTFPENWGVHYGFSSGSVGLTYIALLIGYVVGIAVTNRISDGIYNRMTLNNGNVSKPEFRIPYLVVGAICLSGGLFWYGWGSYHHLPWIFPLVGSGIFAFGLIPVFYCIQNYLIDMNPRFAASAIAAASIFRSYFGFAFPLFAPIMFTNLGYGWGCSIFAFLMIGTGIPFPLFVSLYGERLRIWANKRTERSQAKRDRKNMERLQKSQEKELEKLAARDE